MNKEDYKRVVSNFKADSNLEKNIRQNILYIENQAVNRKNFSLKKMIIGSAVACVIALIIVFEFSIVPNSNNITRNTNPIFTFEGFDVIAHAADGTPRTLTLNTEFVMKEYSPLMSSVPGLPFTIGCKDTSKGKLSIDKIKVSVDNGEIIAWDQGNGVVKNKSKNYMCNTGETIYWSPLCNGSIVKNDTIIILTAIIDNKEVGIQKIIIKALNGNEGKYEAIIEK